MKKIACLLERFRLRNPEDRYRAIKESINFSEFLSLILPNSICQKLPHSYQQEVKLYEKWRLLDEENKIFTSKIKK